MNFELLPILTDYEIRKNAYTVQILALSALK
jgi:hypothetical protein